VLLRVAVPEFDIGEVTIGAPLTFKLWAYPDREFSGTVTEIQPATEEVDYGMVVNVTSRLNNPDGVLISGLTGQAKIRGKNTVVLFAFTKALVRFVSIEVWSWLP
jgi:multidrug efflux pump subunit AcrA (membrane-fusion protein)